MLLPIILLLTLIRLREHLSRLHQRAAQRRRLLYFQIAILRAFLDCFDNSGRFRPRSSLLSRVWFDTVLMRLQSDRFKALVRLERRSFDKLVDRLTPHLHVDYAGPGRQPIPVALQVAAFLYRSAHNTSCAVTGQQFGLAASTVSRTCTKVARAIPEALADQLTFPSHREFLSEITPAFDTISLIPNVGLLIDGCLVNLANAPPWWADPKSFISRKMRYAVNILVAVDHRRRFRDITVGFPGCAHDARVLRSSDLYRLAKDVLPPGYAVCALCFWLAFFRSCMC